MAETLTLEQVIAEYGDVKVRFSSYYKFSFSFHGNNFDGGAVTVSVGGDADEIYRFDVGRDYVRLRDLLGDVFIRSITIKDEAGDVLVDYSSPW